MATLGLSRGCAGWGPVRVGLGLSACALVLAGCSGTPLGDQLARSFSAPPAQPVAPDPTPSGASNKAASTPDPSNKGAKANDSKTQPGKPGAGPGVGSQPRAVQPSNPAPYRITIQLPSADPAAPAEAVTEALRAAGVSFEVEMIERIGAPAPAVTPAPPPAAPSAPPAPTVTPAPAPR
jgi:hypothetical protein